ncbi:MAG: DUF4268 domain-containing protein [bacterium]|nr:MAG: DUF4268 domain-containing protein [bacterium]
MHEHETRQVQDRRTAGLLERRGDGDIRDRMAWNGYFSWLMENAEKFHKVFSKRVKRLSL